MFAGKRTVSGSHDSPVVYSYCRLASFANASPNLRFCSRIIDNFSEVPPVKVIDSTEATFSTSVLSLSAVFSSRFRRRTMSFGTPLGATNKSQLRKSRSKPCDAGGKRGGNGHQVEAFHFFPP